jgi:hypothetical protein
MAGRLETILDRIRTIDGRLLIAGERLSRYRLKGQDTSVTVQQGVVDRMLDERLALMAERDKDLDAPPPSHPAPMSGGKK